jgi:hypothetical protein
MCGYDRCNALHGGLMDLNKKYFGMTVMQLGILAALAGLVFVLFCVVGYLILGKVTGSSVTSLPTATTTIQPTVTMVLTPTPTTTPAATPLPYESLIPAGWAQYRTSLIEVWMPPGYKVTKTTAMLVTGLGGSPIMDLSLTGSTSKKAPNKIYMTVSYEPLTTDTLDAFITQKLTGLGFAPSERSKVTLNTVPAVRLVFTGRKGNTDINELTYVILDGTTVWYIQYTAEINDYYNVLANFESSVKTFRVVK